jgi:arginase
MTDTIAIVGSPTALGGHFGGMDQGPAALRAAGLVDRLRALDAFGSTTFVDHGDAPNDPGWARDDHPTMKNRDRIIEYLPRLSARIGEALAAGDGEGGREPRLLMLGGDCTTHAAAMAALKAHGPAARLAIAWFDAHGDFNVPETTPSGNVWGMPFAMLCGRGDPGLVRAVTGPTVAEEDAALIGAQVLDQDESRMLNASAVAQFGSGMLRGRAGLAALDAWARVVGERCDGLYIAFDLDAIDASEGISVSMPEPAGLSVDTAAECLRILARNNRVLGFGPTATMPHDDVDMSHHTDIVVRLTEAALG